MNSNLIRKINRTKIKCLKNFRRIKMIIKSFTKRKGPYVY